MTIKSLEELKAEHARQIARLEREHALTAKLPTHGAAVEWEGENGWDKEGKRLPPIAKRVELFPWIVHSPTAYNSAEHVAFRAPEGGSADKHSEHTSSKYRPEFVRRYLRALLDVCGPHMLETIAVRCNAQARSNYVGFFPDGFDYTTQTGGSYEHADETARGLFVLEVSRHTGQHGFSTAELEFYISTPEGRCKVSFDLSRDGWPTHKLAPRPRYTSDHHGAGVASWSFAQPGEVGAVELFKRASADRYGTGAPYGYTVEYLIPDRATLDKLLGF